MFSQQKQPAVGVTIGNTRAPVALTFGARQRRNYGGHHRLVGVGAMPCGDRP